MEYAQNERDVKWDMMDRGPESEIRREKDFIQAANKLKTLRVTDGGSMSTDPQELRDQIPAA